MECSECGMFFPDSMPKCPYCGTSKASLSEMKEKSLAQKIEGILEKGRASYNQEKDSSKIFEEASDAVFEIVSVNKSTNSAGCGTGFLINKEGFIVTNRHMVAIETRDASGEYKLAGEYDQIVVKFKEGKLVANIVGYAEREFGDIAVIKVDSVPYGIKPLMLGDSDLVKTGDQIYAIGNSHGEGICMTQGIISDSKREMEGRSVIMSDVATNPGNSGCPYLNSAGKVVALHYSGHTNAVFNGARIKAQGMNYGEPINRVKKFLRLKGVNFLE